MNSDLTKSQRRKLRELSGLAYDRELARELASLESEFAKWRSGEFGPHELNDRIHKFHQGPSRQLFVYYSNANNGIAVASAIVRGVLTEAEAGPEMLKLLAGSLEFCRAQHALDEEDDELEENGRQIENKP